jgi:hypothetical protein
MTEPRDAAVHFEGVKISLKQDKSGFILTVAIHPNDVPESLLRDWVGSRYMVAMVKMDDENRPVEPPEVKAGREAVAKAGQLCKLPRFQKWLFRAGYAFEESEAAAADAIKDVCQIQSRSDLKTDAGARATFEELVEAFKKEIEG